MSSMKYPYRDLGVTFDRNFRNDLNANFDDIEHDIKMVGGEAAQQALEAAEEANTQAIYAQTSGDYANDKGDYAAQQGDYAKTQGDYAKAQGDYAKAQADYAKQVGDENKTRYLAPVPTFTDIATTYPNPQHGDTVQTLDDGKFYRYEAGVGQWKFKEQYTDTAIGNIITELSKQNKQSVTIGHGLNVINASQNSPLDVRIEGRTLVNVSQNVLDSAKYYVLADKKSKVKFSDGTTYTGVAKFQGKAEKPILIRVENFEGKVGGSTLENPHISKHNIGESGTGLKSPSSFTQAGAFTNIAKQDGVVNTITVSANGAQAQHLFSFNLIEAIERNVGKIPASDTAKVAWLKNNIAKLTCNWWGRGESPSGYKASLTRWITTSNKWDMPCVLSHMNSSVKKLSFTLFSSTITTNVIDANGFVHFIAYADPSDGVTASTIYTDYVELEIELNQNAQLWNPRFPLYEVTSDEYNNILVSWDENEVLRRYPMVESVQHVQNPYVIIEGENLLPPFTDSAWTIHANAIVQSPYSLTFNSASLDINSIVIPVMKNTTYTLSADHNGQISIFKKYKGGSEDGYYVAYTSNQQITFTTDNVHEEIRIYFRNLNNSYLKNPMLTLGSTAKPFVPRNPSTLYIDGVKLGALSDKKDILFKDGQDWKVTKWIEKDVALDGKLAWIFWNDQAGYKTVALENAFQNPLASGYGTSEIVQKFNGNIINFKALDTDGADSFTFYDAGSGIKRLKLRISDTDSGWDEHYKPSTQEIQAYFNGWKANGYTTGTAVTNELTGQLAPSGTYTFANAGAYRNVVVEKSTDGSTWSPAVENTDFKIDISGSKAVLTNLSLSPLYFRISYNYGVTVNSWASLVDGSAPATNTLAYVSANLAPNFTPYKLSYVLATPQTIVVTDKVEGDLVVNGATQVEVGSGFTYTEVDGKRTYTKLAENQRYNVTSNILSIIANYDSSLKSVVDDVVAKQSDIAAQVSVNVRAIAELYKRVKALGG